MMSLEFRRDFWRRKRRVSGLSYGVVSVILGFAIFVQLRLVTDRRTVRRTDTLWQLIPCWHSSHGKNRWTFGGIGPLGSAMEWRTTGINLSAIATCGTQTSPQLQTHRDTYGHVIKTEAAWSHVYWVGPRVKPSDVRQQRPSTCCCYHLLLIIYYYYYIPAVRNNTL